jgi:acylphosphatase
VTAAARTVAVRISGRVQGVWYRAWTAETATRLGLSGWVRNEPDGTVAALFHGPGEIVSAMLDACREGPPAARVDQIETAPADAPGHADFRILR